MPNGADRTERERRAARAAWQRAVRRKLRLGKPIPEPPFPRPEPPPASTTAPGRPYEAYHEPRPSQRVGSLYFYRRLREAPAEEPQPEQVRPSTESPPEGAGQPDRTPEGVYQPEVDGPSPAPLSERPFPSPFRTSWGEAPERQPPAEGAAPERPSRTPPMEVPETFGLPSLPSLPSLEEPAQAGTPQASPLPAPGLGPPVASEAPVPVEPTPEARQEAPPQAPPQADQAGPRPEPPPAEPAESPAPAEPPKGEEPPEPTELPAPPEAVEWGEQRKPPPDQPSPQFPASRPSRGQPKLAAAPPRQPQGPGPPAEFPPPGDVPEEASAPSLDVFRPGLSASEPFPSLAEQRRPGRPPSEPLLEQPGDSGRPTPPPAEPTEARPSRETALPAYLDRLPGAPERVAPDEQPVLPPDWSIHRTTDEERPPRVAPDVSGDRAAPPAATHEAPSAVPEPEAAGPTAPERIDLPDEPSAQPPALTQPEQPVARDATAPSVEGYGDRPGGAGPLPSFGESFPGGAPVPWSGPQARGDERSTEIAELLRELVRLASEAMTRLAEMNGTLEEIREAIPSAGALR